jgi:hypothetical protein
MPHHSDAGIRIIYGLAHLHLADWQARLERSSAMLNGVRDRAVYPYPSNPIAVSVSILIIVVIVAGPA